MFDAITIPFESVMLFNTATLKENVDFDEVEMAIAEMCSLVKETYPDFLAGQVFKYEGLISTEGSVGNEPNTKEHIAIVTYWKSFDSHEESHKNENFKKAFADLMRYCTDTEELGYKLLWQGESEN